MRTRLRPAPPPAAASVLRLLALGIAWLPAAAHAAGCPPDPAGPDGTLAVRLVSSDLERPVDATHPPGDETRLFVVEQPGRIRILDLASDTLRPEPFLDISDRLACCGERGLLGLAFSPRWSEDRAFYVDYTRRTDGATVVSRLRGRADDPDLADPDSEEVLLTIPQPFRNHNGGQLLFGPVDGYLYISTGDGGDGGDPQDNGQDPTSLLGKILRIDVETTSDDLAYGIPPTNPFLEEPGVRDEIWALGLRNPWRCAFDAATGDLYIADVGQGAWEEVNFEAAGDPGGRNYGWRLREGSHPFNATGLTGPGIPTDPVLEYPHSGGTYRGCSVSGGVVYRGCDLPFLRGAYLFADYCENWVRVLRIDGGEVVEDRDVTAELNAAILPDDRLDDVVGFGTDGRGEVYVLDHGTKLFRIVAGPSAGGTFRRGDSNADGALDLSDGVATLSWLFLGLGAPDCVDAADADDSGDIDISDAVFTFLYLFAGGSAPPAPGPEVCGEDPTDDGLGCGTLPPDACS